MGLDDYLADRSAITLIEWPERAEEMLPEERLWIAMRIIDTNKRIMMLTAYGDRYKEVLYSFRKRAFGV